MRLSEKKINLDCAVILPIFTTKLSHNELNSIKSNIEVLKKWDHIIICPETKSEAIQNFLNPFQFNYKIIKLKDYHFHSVTTYDQLLRKKWFYELFKDYRFILITQPDVVIFKDDLAKWIEKDFDYIGAPWVIKDSEENINFYVGNGGFSLRKIRSFLDSFNRFKILKCPIWYLEKKGISKRLAFIFQFVFGFNKFVFSKKLHEDFFWSQLIPSTNKKFVVAPPEIAFEFAIENFESINIDQMPFAVHAWEKFAPEKIKKKIQEFIN